jgi:SHS2 domain-containing protein
MPSRDEPDSGQGPLFREFEHTGDIGIELEAPDRNELFRRAAIAIAALLVERSGVAAAEEREVTVKAASDEDMMHDLLEDLLTLFIVDTFIWSDASVQVRDDGSLRVRLYGERFDPARHEFRGEIKAVTYHQLSVRQSVEGWKARVIFDV